MVGRIPRRYQINGKTGLKDVATGGWHSVALLTDGTVRICGNVQFGYSIYQSDYGTSLVPPGLSGVKKIFANDYRTVALKDNGRVVAWGGGA